MLTRLLGYAFIRFIIPFTILIIKILTYAIITFIIPFILNRLKKKLDNQQRLLCSKCHGKLQVINKEGNFYCKNCKIIKFDPH
jgi:hypothetical protein